MPSERRCVGRNTPGPLTMRSPIATVPWSGRSSPAMMRIVVVLPEPLGPSSVTNSPFSTTMPKSATAFTVPNILVTLLSSILLMPLWVPGLARRAGASP